MITACSRPCAASLAFHALISRAKSRRKLFPGTPPDNDKQLSLDEETINHCLSLYTERQVVDDAADTAGATDLRDVEAQMCMAQLVYTKVRSHYLNAI
jgi:hypothetical protein